MAPQHGNQATPPYSSLWRTCIFYSNLKELYYNRPNERRMAHSVPYAEALVLSMPLRYITDGVTVTSSLHPLSFPVAENLKKAAVRVSNLLRTQMHIGAFFVVNRQLSFMRPAVKGVRFSDCSPEFRVICIDQTRGLHDLWHITD